MRIMGLDYGSRTVGVAVSDPSLLIATGVETIVRKEELKLRKTFRRIEELVREYDVTEIVVGLPVLMSGEKGERARLSEEFADCLRRRTGLPVHMYDERLTTVAADEVLEENGVPQKDRKKVIDRIAACFILQDYLDNLKLREPNTDGRTDCI